MGILKAIECFIHLNKMRTSSKHHLNTVIL